MTKITSFSQDSGIIGDGITNDSTLTLLGTSSAYSAVQVYDGTTLLGSVTADSSGAWSYTTATLSNGTHSFIATGTTTTTSSGFPDATNTGVPAGTSLKTVNGDFTTSYAGQVIDGLNIQGTIIVSNPGVIIQNCQAQQIEVDAGNCTIQDSNIVGTNQPGSSGIAILFADSTTVQRCSISGVENGIWLESNNCLIQNNYLHDFIPYNSATDPHIDGIQIPQSASSISNNVITHNNINLAQDVSSDITMKDATNIQISDNQLNGGTYNIYFEGNTTGCSVTNNTFLSHLYGTIAGTAADAQTVTGNTFSTTGTGTTGTTTSVTTDTSPAFVVTIDTKAPAAPTIANDTVDSANHLVLSGNAEANSTVKVYDGTTQVGTATADSTGGWSVTTSVLSTGTHGLTATATDAAGNVSAASSVVNAIIGLNTSGGSSGSGSPGTVAAPVIASFSPDSGVVGDGITNANILDLKGIAAANSTVKIYDGSTQIGSTTADSSGAWDYITKVLTDAKHTLTATVTNSSGTSAASSALDVTVDTKAPAAPTIASDTVNSANQVVVSGNAEANSTIKVYDGTTQIGTAATNSSGAWSVTTSALSVGSHALTATATDVAGNVSAASAAVDPVIGSGTSSTSGSGTSGSSTSGSSTSGTTSGTTAPAAPKIGSFSKDTGVTGDHITSDNALSLTGSAAANSTVKVYDGTSQIGTVTADASGAWNYATSALIDGKHSFTATDTVSGATSAASAALAVTVDTAAPDAPILSSESVTHNRATVTGTAEAGSTVKLYEGTSLVGSATADAAGNFSVTTSNLKQGTHTFVATATDAAGNASGLSQPIDPAVGSQGPKTGSTVEITNVNQHQDHTATIKGIADPNSQIKLYDGTAAVGSVTAGADGHWSASAADQSSTTHTFTAQQLDSAGQVVGTSSGAAILGSSHADTLASTAGNDVLVGKGGGDTFVFSANFGHDVIKDFATSGPNHDTVQFSNTVFDSFASVLSHATQSGHDVVISTGSDTLTLKNTKLDALNSHDFHFA